MFELSRLKKRTRTIAVGLAASGMVMGNVASVAALSSSSMTLSDPRPSETGVTYTFDSDGWDTGTTLECVRVAFTVNADGTGGVPAGMTTTGASLNASSTAVTAASWTEDFAANGILDIIDGTEAILASPSNLVFDTITNPNTDDTFYATVSTYTSNDCSTGPVDSGVVAFATKDGTPVSVTIDPTLTFTCTGLGTGQSINGETTTHVSTGGSIDYLNDVTASTSGVSAHDLGVTSNASGGYVVYVRHSGDLSSGTDTITTHTGTNAAPSTMSAGTEGWGYTTNDATLSGGTANRFTSSTNLFAGFQTSNEVVMVDSGTQTTRVGHQVDVAATTEAGTYTTDIIYTVVATF